MLGKTSNLTYSFSPLRAWVHIRPQPEIATGFGQQLVVPGGSQWVNRQPSNGQKSNRQPSKWKILTVNRQLNQAKLAVKSLEYLLSRTIIASNNVVK